MKKMLKPLVLLACLLLPGAGVLAGADDACAEGWLSKFVASMKEDANGGDVTAQFTLGLMYYEGQGVEHDYAQARHWLEMAAAQDHADALFTLGEMYIQGNGVAKNPPMAAGWFEKAAREGHAEAQYQLGCLYDAGQGVEKDTRKAWEWFGKSCSAGFKKSCGR